MHQSSTVDVSCKNTISVQPSAFIHTQSKLCITLGIGGQMLENLHQLAIILRLMYT